MEDNIRLGLQYTSLQWALFGCGIIGVLFLSYYALCKKNEFLLCLKNVFRNFRRSLLVIIAIASAIMGNLLIGTYFLTSFEGLRERTIRGETGHLVLMKKGYYEEGAGSPADYIIENSKEIISIVKNNADIKPFIKTITTQVRFTGIIHAGDKNLSYSAVAVNPGEDSLVSTAETVVHGQNLSPDTPYEIMLGEGLAQQLEVTVNEDVTLIGSVAGGGLNALDTTIRGIVKPISRDYSNVLVKTSLTFAEEMTLSEGANKIVIVLHDTRKTQKVREVIASIIGSNSQWNVQLYDWYQLQDFYRKVNGFLGSIFIVVSSLLLGLVIFLVVNTVTMSVFERFSEFGTLRAIGLKKRQLVAMVLIENIITAILGVLLGIVLSYGVGLIIQVLDIALYPPPGQTIEVPLDVLLQFRGEYLLLIACSSFATIGMTLLTACLPAMKATRLRIVDCIRYV